MFHDCKTLCLVATLDYLEIYFVMKLQFWLWEFRTWGYTFLAGCLYEFKSLCLVMKVSRVVVLHLVHVDII